MKKFARSRKTWRKGVRKARAMKRTKRAAASRVHLFKRLGVTSRITNTTTAGSVISTGNLTLGSTTGPNNFGYDFGASMIFRLQDVEQYTELISMYDRYKISGVKIKIIPLSNVSGSGGLSFLPELMYAIDPDDGSVPTETYMRQKGAKCRRLDKPVNIYLRPKVATQLYQSAIATGYGVANAPYINSASFGVEHYGLKMYFRNVDLRANTAVSTQFNIETTFYLAMKDPQ